MKIALDTNLLVYAEGMNGSEKQNAILDVFDRLPQGSRVMSVQVLGELFGVMLRKARLPAAESRAIVLKWRNNIPVIGTTDTLMLTAIELASDHGLSVWDAVMVAAAASYGCQLFLSEDMHHGFTWSGVTIANPFAMPLHPLLADALSE